MHPIEKGDYVLPTNPLEEFVNVMVGWIRDNLPGAIVPGLQRIGKTFAMEYFVANCSKWLGDDVGVVSTEVAPHKATTEGQLFLDLLRGMKRPTKKRSPEDRRDLFVGRLVEAGSKSRLRRVVVFLDEGQLLDDFAFKLLISVHNDLLRIYNIQAVWILVGQLELETMRTTYLQEGKRQIIGRFMADMYKFRPLTGVTDFKEALECYDKHMHFPKGGPSFTARFAPELVAAGWGVADDAPIILGAIEKAREARGLPAGNGMTMQGFVTLMNHLFQHQLPLLKVGEHLTEAMVTEAIEATNCMLFEEQEALLSGA